MAAAPSCPTRSPPIGGLLHFGDKPKADFHGQPEKMAEFEIPPLHQLSRD
jgi:hypothetical protein